MKRIVVSLLVLFAACTSFAQPITRRAMDVNTVSDARLQAEKNLFIPKYTDTTAANLSKGIDSCSAIIFTYDGNTQWIRACNPKRWVKAAGSLVAGNTPSVTLSGDGSTATPLTADVNLSSTGQNAIVALPDGLYVPNSVRNGLVWGGTVTWISGYTYSVAEAFYYINGAPFHSPTTTITLDPSDNDSSRIDLIVVNNQNLVAVDKGSLSPSPLEPSINPATELRLSIVLVQAGTTEPTNNGTGLRRDCIYQENTEWTTASSNARINPNSTNAPCVGSKDVEGTGVLNGDYVRFTRPSGNITLLDSFKVITFQIKSKANWGNRNLILRWQSSGVNVGGVVNLTGTSYGWSSNLTGVCQTISIPLTDFGLPVGASVNQLLITASMSNGSIGFYLDQMCLQNQEQPNYATPITLQNGLNLDASTNIGELGGTLLHNTTNNTNYFVHTLYGNPVYDYPYQFQQGQNFGNGTGVTSFLSKGAVYPTSPDYNNTVRIGLNYTSNLYNNSPATEGYFGDRIGYMLNTNLRGHGSFGMYQDDYKAKNVGIFFHTRDNIYRDGVTIFAADSSNVAGDYSGSALKTHKVAIFKTTGALQLPKYGAGTFTGTVAYNLAVDASGNIIEVTGGGGGGSGTDNANAGTGYRVLIPSTQQVKTLFNGYAVGIDSSSNTNGLTFKADTSLLTTNAHLYKVVDSLPKGIVGIAANNGLTANTNSNVQLGGVLIQNTTISTNTYETLWSGSNTNYILGLTNNSTGAGLVVNNNSSGSGIQSYSDHGIALYGLTAGISTSGIDRVLVVEKGNAGPGLNGNGVSMEFAIKTSTTGQTSNSLVSKWTDALNTTRSSQFEIYGVNSAVTARKLAIAPNGKLTLDGYGAGTLTGTPTYGLSVDASGNVIESAIGSVSAPQDQVVYGTTTGIGSTSNFKFLTTNNQLQLGAYTTESSFVGTVAGDLSFDATGKVLTRPTNFGNPVIAGAANYTLLSGDNYISMEPFSSNVTLTIPDPTTCKGRIVWVTNQGTLQVVLSRGAYYASASSSTNIPAGSTWVIVSDGTKWVRGMGGEQYTVTDATFTGLSLIATGNHSSAAGTRNNLLRGLKGGVGATVTVSTNDLVISTSDVTAKTASYTATSSDYTITGDATAAAFQVTLPTAVGIKGKIYTIKKIDASANAVTVGTTSSQTIDGSTTYGLSARWKYVTIESDGANWIIIGNN